MKVILLKDIKKQGKKGEIKEFANGYATFLIKNKDAIALTEGSMKHLQKENLEKKQKEEKDIKEAKEIAKQLEKITITIKVKTGKEDRVFGSISTKQIAEELKKRNFVIDKKKIQLKNEISSLGYHEVEILLHKKVIAPLKIQLVKE